MVRVISESEPRGRREWLLGVVGIAIGMYLLLVWLPFHVFGPRLEIIEVIVPATIKPARPFRIGLKVVNTRWGSGAAYAVFLVEGETEIEGPITPIPARGETEVGVSLTLDTGVRNASLLLYDAMHGNQRLDGRNGIHVVVGSEPIRLTEARFPPLVTSGETMSVKLLALVDAPGPFEVLPIVVVSDSRNRYPVESEGSEALLDSGINVLEVAVPTGRLAPGLHLVTVGLYNPGDRRWIGRRISRRELTVVAP